jgi:hypothetical protein
LIAKIVAVYEGKVLDIDMAYRIDNRVISWWHKHIFFCKRSNPTLEQRGFAEILNTR